MAGQIWLVLGLWLLCKHISRRFSHFFEKLPFLAFLGLRNFNFGQFQSFLDIDLRGHDSWSMGQVVGMIFFFLASEVNPGVVFFIFFKIFISGP